MDKIYECAAKFVALESHEYRFVVSAKRKSRMLRLNFCDSDFFHLAGFQYLSDISIPQNRQNTIKDIIDKKCITDELLGKSRFYKNPKTDKDIKSRIEELRFLEEYLDVENMIRIFNLRNDKHIQSMIEADYVIESKFKRSKESVYIFLRLRKEDPEHLCVASFFKKGTVTYGGEKLYWMLKEKISIKGSVVLYQHPNY